MMEEDLVENEAAGLSPLAARDALRRFAQRAGAPALRLALHAALPQVLHAELLHALRLNFADDGSTNPVAEADVMFAPFCEELGNGYFRLDAMARTMLLRELDSSYPGQQRPRSLQVADFLLAWCERERVAGRGELDPMYRSWLEVERWNSLAFAEPDTAAEALAAALQGELQGDAASARLSLGTLALALELPLVRHERLLAYAAGLQSLREGNAERAQALLARAGPQPVAVGSVVLPQPTQVLAAARQRPAAPPPAQAESTRPNQPDGTGVPTPPAPQPAAPAEPNLPTPPPDKESRNSPPASARPAASPLPAGSDVGYTAFISYAHADNVAWFDWVTHFRVELERHLRATLRGVHLPPVHLSGENGPVSGNLGSELRERVANSFAMIVVVHDNYVHSEWSLRELEYFASIFGEQSLRERLYVIALSETAMQRLESSAAWQRLLPRDFVWLPFFDEEQRDQPMEIYLGPELVSPRFSERFVRLRDDLATKLRASHVSANESWRGVGRPRQHVPPDQRESGAPPSPPAGDKGTGPPAPAAARAGPRIYIESNRFETDLWQSLGERLRRTWPQLVGRVSTEPAAQPPDLRVRGLPVDQLDRMRPLDDADGVVLLWGRKSAEALVAQINRVEDKLAPGRDAPPGIVAYLMPPQRQTEGPVPAWGWPVLRIDATNEQEISVVREEAGELESFLRAVFEHWLRRGGSVESGLDPRRPIG